MATTHETEHAGGHHPSFMQYVVIAILLFAITIVEFLIILDFPGPRGKVISEALGQPSTTILLFLLSGIKFGIVILFYMHLKFDNKLFFWVFIAGMALAVMVGLSLMGLFTAVQPTLGGEPRAPAVAVPCSFDHEQMENVCPTPEPQPTSTPHPMVTPLPEYSSPATAETSASASVDISGPPSADIGAGLVQKYGCAACHSIDGSELVGPSWKGIYESQEALGDGTSVTVNDEYITESIKDPNAKVVQGFTAGLMPATLGVTDEEIPHLIEYIKSLK